MKTKACMVKRVNESKGTIDFVLTSKTIDRDGEVVLPRGVDTKNFQKNPVFLWAHSRKDPPLGKVLPSSINKSEEEMTGTVEFDLDDPFAASIFRKYQKGYLNAGSISFIPKKIGSPILDGQNGDTFEQVELLEFSGVPVPSNSQALAIKEFGESGNWMEMVKKFYEDCGAETPTTDKWCKFVEKAIVENDDKGFENIQQQQNESEKDLLTEENRMDDTAKKTDIEKNANSNDEWTETAQQMVELFNNLDKYTTEEAKEIYEQLSKRYVELGKKPPELLMPSENDEILEVLEQNENALINEIVNLITQGEKNE